VRCCITCPGATDDEERQPRGDNRLQQPSGVEGYGPGNHQGIEALRRRTQHPKGQARAVGGDRREHRVQAHARPAVSRVRQAAVHPWLRLVQPSAGGQRQSLRQPAHRCLVGKTHLGPLQSRTAVHPHLVRGGDQHIGYVRFPQ